MNNQQTYRYQILSEFWIKVLGFVFMACDHIGVFMLSYAEPSSNLYEAALVFRIIGRLAFPLFCFMLAEGMRYTHSKPKYLLRLLLLHLLITAAQLLAPYFFHIDLSNAANPFADLLLLGLLLWALSSKGWYKLLALLPLGVLILCYAVSVYEVYNDVTVYWWPFSLRPAYSMLGLFFALGFYYSPKIAIFAAHKVNQSMGISDETFLEIPSGRRLINTLNFAFLLSTMLLFWCISYIGMTSTGFSPFDPFGMRVESWGILAGVLLLLYRGDRGYDAKWFRYFEYAFYPLHIVILYLIFFAIFGA